MSTIITVFLKEVRENFRDRRALTSALVFGPLFGPIVFSLLIGMIVRQEQERAEDVLELPVIGAQYAPNLVNFLERSGVEIAEAPDEPEAAIRSQERDVILEIGAQYAEQLRSGQPAEVTLIVDKSRRESETDIRRVRTLLAAYGGQIGALRLQARGVNPTVVRAIQVSEQDLSTPQSRGALLMTMLPYFVMLSVFIGGMHLAIDTTAGERERSSLEPLLVNPSPRWQIMAGKLIATLSFALISLAITLVAFSISMRFIPLEAEGLSLTLDPGTGFMIFLLVAPVALLASALQTIVASFSKSFREAQTYLSFLMFVPMVPSLAMFVLTWKATTKLSAVPILGQNLLIERMMRGEGAPLDMVAISVICTVAVGLVLALIAARLYDNERIAFAS